MRNAIWLGLVLLFLPAAESAAQQTGSAGGGMTVPTTDLQATQVLAQNVQADIDLAQKAAQHSSDERVKSLGNAVAGAHKADLDRLEALERNLGGGPTSTPKAAPAEQQDPGPLENAVGAEFDRIFLEMLARQLTDTQTMARRVAGSSLGAPVKDAARKLAGEIDGQLKQITTLRAPR